GGSQRLLAVRRLADHFEPLLRKERGQRVSGERMVVDDEDSFAHETLIGNSRAADKRAVEHSQTQSYRSWLVGELLVVGLLASATALFASSQSLQSAYALPEARLAFDSTVAVVAVIVAVLATVRFRVDGRTLDLLLAGGFWSISLGTVAFGLIPVLGGGPLPAPQAWSLLAALLAFLWLVALVGFALRYRRYGRDLDSWICLAATLAFFAELHLVITPNVSGDYVLEGDLLRLLAYGILLVGVWRAIADAEFG